MRHFGPNVGHNIFDQYEMLQILVVQQILKSVYIMLHDWT